MVIESTSLKKEEPAAPPFLLYDVLLAILCAVYCGGGFGIKFFTEAAFILIATLILVNSSKRGILFIGAIIVTSILLPALIQSPALLSTILFAGNRPKHAVLVLLGSALQFVGQINPFYLPVILIPIVAIVSMARLKCHDKCLQVATIFLLSINILPTLFPQSTPQGHKGFEFPYQIEIAEHTNRSDNVKCYTSIDNYGDIDSAKILILEHDAPKDMASHNWIQRRSWTQNQYFGAPLFRIATSLDGFLYSNLGCRIDGSSFRYLGEAHREEHNDFISKKSGQIVFSDSDFLLNGSIGYQDNLIKSIFCRFSIAQLILLGTALSCAFSLWKITKSFAMPVAGIVALVSIIMMHSKTIDVRISSSSAPWPHSKGIGGLGSEIDETSGIKIVSRHGRAQILAIGRGSEATICIEKVVVMEGNSSVIIDGITYEALDLPQGNVEGIINAIPIRKKGETDNGKCIQKIGKITLIGTNSARSNSKIIYASIK
jgi:hypothetical protein